MVVTLYDIAKVANTSYATVSRALSNQPRISQETRVRVINAARKLGYRPSHAGRTLKSGKTHTIGLVLSTMTNPYYLEMLQFLKAECLARGYQLISIDYGMDPKQERRYLEQMLGRQCDGIISVLTRFDPLKDLVEEFWVARLPFVILGLPDDIGALKVDGVGIRMNVGIEKAINHLVSLGHREIVMAVSCPPENEPERYHILAEAFQKYDLPFKSDNFFSHFTGDELQDGRYCAREILQKRSQTTAIIGVNDLFITGFMRQLIELGKKVPDDISLVGTDNTWIGREWPITLTSIDMRTKEFARSAATILFERLQNNVWNDPIHINLETDLVIRESTGPARKTDKCL